jgi:hypothetical protein
LPAPQIHRTATPDELLFVVETHNESANVSMQLKKGTGACQISPERHTR